LERENRKFDPDQKAKIHVENVNVADVTFREGRTFDRPGGNSVAGMPRFTKIALWLGNATVDALR
jgi:hypothetical protein